jgi:hypothetical protein
MNFSRKADKAVKNVFSIKKENFDDFDNSDTATSKDPNRNTDNLTSIEDSSPILESLRRSTDDMLSDPISMLETECKEEIDEKLKVFI